MHDPPHCGAYLYRRLTSAHGGLARRVRVVTMVTPQLSTALGSFCWPDVVMWDWLQRQKGCPCRRGPWPEVVCALRNIRWPDVFLWNWFQWMYAFHCWSSRQTSQVEQLQHFKPDGSRVQAQPAISRILETETYSEPSSKRVENAVLATFSGHLKGGVHDPSFAAPIYIED